MKVSGLIPAVLLCAALLPVQAPAQDGYTIYLTASENAGVPLREPATTFSCSDRIYAVVEINRPGGGTGQHTLYAAWRNPAGEDQEITEYQFQQTEGYARIWAWLKLERSGAAAAVQFMKDRKSVV